MVPDLVDSGRLLASAHGWAASRRGERLSRRDVMFIKDKALESLASISECEVDAGA